MPKPKIKTPDRQRKVVLNGAARRVEELPALVHRGQAGYKQRRRLEEIEPDPMIEPGDDPKTKEARRRMRE